MSVGRERPWRRRLLTALGIAVLLLELGFVVGGIAGASWWFTWGPNDHLYRYRISVSVRGRPLDAAAIERRYHRPARGAYEDPIVELEDLVHQYETTYGRDDNATVVIKATSSGEEEVVWRWPRR